MIRETHEIVMLEQLFFSLASCQIKIKLSNPKINKVIDDYYTLLEIEERDNAIDT